MKLRCYGEINANKTTVEQLIEKLNALPPKAMLDGVLEVEWEMEQVAVGSVSNDCDEPTDKPNPLWQHPDGTTRSISNRWGMAIDVQCPDCGKGPNIRCVRSDGHTQIMYPHNRRVKEGFRVALEKGIDPSSLHYETRR